MPDETDREILLHATAIAIGASGVLLRGPPGAGKSDLALRLLMRATSPFDEAPISLVADDYVIAAVRSDDATSAAQRGLEVRVASAAISGLIEVRGLGVYTFPARESALLRLIVDLAGPGDTIVRLPDAEDALAEISGVRIPRIRVAAFEASAPDKVLIAVSGRRMRDDEALPPR